MPNIFKEMIKKQVKIKEDTYFGLGWLVYDLGNGNYALSHSGADHGTRCIAFLLPQSGKGLLIFTNSDNGYKVYEKLVFIIWEKKERNCRYREISKLFTQIKKGF
jgi:hypothetical protein